MTIIKEIGKNIKAGKNTVVKKVKVVGKLFTFGTLNKGLLLVGLAGFIAVVYEYRKMLGNRARMFLNFLIRLLNKVLRYFDRETVGTYSLDSSEYTLDQKKTMKMERKNKKMQLRLRQRKGGKGGKKGKKGRKGKKGKNKNKNKGRKMKKMGKALGRKKGKRALNKLKKHKKNRK